MSVIIIQSSSLPNDGVSGWTGDSRKIWCCDQKNSSDIKMEGPRGVKKLFRSWGALDLNGVQKSIMAYVWEKIAMGFLDTLKHVCWYQLDQVWTSTENVDLRCVYRSCNCLQFWYLFVVMASTSRYSGTTPHICCIASNMDSSIAPFGRLPWPTCYTGEPNCPMLLVAVYQLSNWLEVWVFLQSVINGIDSPRMELQGIRYFTNSDIM